MAYEANGAILIDEIDRLFVVYDRAKEYITKISSGIDEQIGLWQHRRQIILDQMRTSSSFDFLLPKTQRINELTIDAVQALCRTDLLIEQILRIDPKSVTQSSRPLPASTSFSARSIDTNMSHLSTNTLLTHNRHHATSPAINSTKQSYVEPLSNGKSFGQQSYLMPVLRTQQTPLSRLTGSTIQEKSVFKPIEQQQSSIILDNTPRPTPIHPQTNHYPAPERVNYSRSNTVTSYGTRTPQSEHVTSPMAVPSTSQMTSSYQAPRDKVKVKLQRIPPGTKWKQAKIDVIDSLSAFYVENLDPKVHDPFARMLSRLHDFYNNLEKSKNLMPLENVSIGDFGVAKFSEDKRWYRARLLMCEEQNQVKIVFIDFGNIETISMREFFPLDKSFTDLPAQAIACTLSEAFPRAPNDGSSFWPNETIQIFRDEVMNKVVEVSFSNMEGTELWPLHFVKITVGNQTVTNLLNLEQRIEPKPNRFIADHLSNSLTHQEYILFNVPISDDEYDQ